MYGLDPMPAEPSVSRIVTTVPEAIEAAVGGASATVSALGESAVGLPAELDPAPWTIKDVAPLVTAHFGLPHPVQGRRLAS